MKKPGQTEYKKIELSIHLNVLLMGVNMMNLGFAASNYKVI